MEQDFSPGSRSLEVFPQHSAGLHLPDIYVYMFIYRLC